MPSTKLENKRDIGGNPVRPGVKPGDPPNSDYQGHGYSDLGAKDPWEGSKHAPATYNMDPNDIRQRPFPQPSTDTYPDDPAELGW